VPNRRNSDLINKFYEFMRSSGVSESHQNNTKCSNHSANFLGDEISFTDVNKPVASFILSQYKNKESRSRS
jgi:hypothetical protein